MLLFCSFIFIKQYLQYPIAFLFLFNSLKPKNTNFKKYICFFCVFSSSEKGKQNFKRLNLIKVKYYTGENCTNVQLETSHCYCFCVFVLFRLPLLSKVLFEVGVVGETLIFYIPRHVRCNACNHVFTHHDNSNPRIGSYLPNSNSNCDTYFINFWCIYEYNNYRCNYRLSRASKSMLFFDLLSCNL